LIVLFLKVWSVSKNEGTRQVYDLTTSSGTFYADGLLIHNCKAFGRYIVPTREKDAISMIQKHGIACPDCSRLIDVTKGEWVHRYPERLDPNITASTFAGYHIPATIVYDVLNPHDRYLETIYDKLHGIRPYSEAKFLQEILGISSDQGGRPISKDEIKEISVLDINLGQPSITPPNLANYLCIGGGADWGGSEITSFTVGTLVGWHRDGLFHCLGAVRPTGVPDNERHFPLAAFFKKVGNNLWGIGADAGFVGTVQNRNLARAAGTKVASIMYGTKKMFYQAYPANNFVVDRSTLMWIAYTLMKDHKLLFPKGVDFEKFSIDLTATYIEDVEAPNGITIRRYCRYKQMPDDFLHALGYAIFVVALGMKLDLPGMLGISPKSSVNKPYIDMIGEEGNFKNYNDNQFMG